MKQFEFFFNNKLTYINAETLAEAEILIKKKATANEKAEFTGRVLPISNNHGMQ